tara:strand:- start:253 stop:396 length:144 start_codon:yes stop_codon:yes gene_type:complete
MVLDIAGVAELVDAPDSKSGSLLGVGVRFPSPAPTKINLEVKSINAK